MLIYSKELKFRMIMLPSEFCKQPGLSTKLLALVRGGGRQARGVLGHAHPENVLESRIDRFLDKSIFIIQVQYVTSQIYQSGRV